MTGDVRELRPELSVIPLNHTPRQIIARGRHKRIRHKRARRDKSARWLIRVSAASLAMNMIQSVIIYILQAGPI